jgi:arylsulfatase A-like enzyme
MRQIQLCLLILTWLFAVPRLALCDDTPPNVVIFLIDDLGYMDVGCNNPDTFYETPNVDRIAAGGVRFTNGYSAAPVCSPTRYSIMTGRSPARAACTEWFTGGREARFRGAAFNNAMPLDEFTIAEALHEAGYRTACVGKWHLGPNEEFWPERQGFDINIGGHHAGSPPGGYFSPYTNPRLSDGPEGEHLPDRLASEAIRFIDQEHDSPLFLYMPFYSVHTPLEAPADLIAKYEAKAAAIVGDEFAEEEQIWPVDDPRRVRVLQKHAVYAAMIESMDAAIGRVLTHLDEQGLSDNTVIVFTSDNGGLSTSEGSPTSNLPLRGGKGWLYEGGIRVPYIIRWPGHAVAGSVCDEPVVSTDFYPTLLEIAGLPPRPEQHLDGVSLVPLLTQQGPLDREAIFWHYPHYSNQGGFPGGAVRIGDFKLIERYEDGRVHLFNLASDIGERNDLAEAMPDRVNAMRARLHDWYDEVEARFLEPLPDGPMPWRP